MVQTDHGQYLNHTNNCTKCSQPVFKPHKQPLTDHSTNNWPQPVSKPHKQLYWLTTASIQTTQTTTDWSQPVSKPHKQPLADHSQYPNHTSNHWLITAQTIVMTAWSRPVSKPHKQLYWLITASIQTTQATTDWSQHKLYWLITASV